MFIDRTSKGSYYDVLMVQPNSSDSEIKDAYKKLSDIYHPERTTLNKKIAALRFRLINEAYAALRTEEGRTRYNKLLLLRSGKPNGLKLAGVNDNYNPQEKKIRDLLSGLIKPRTKIPPSIEISEEEIEAQRDETLSQEERIKKDRDHG